MGTNTSPQPDTGNEQTHFSLILFIPDLPQQMPSEFFDFAYEDAFSEVNVSLCYVVVLSSSLL